MILGGIGLGVMLLLCIISIHIGILRSDIVHELQELNKILKDKK